MKKRAPILTMLVLAVMLMAPCPGVLAKKGIDRSKIKGLDQIYPAVLTIGGMSFRGKVSRMDKATDEEIEKAIKDALKDMGMTELEVSEAQDTVDRVAKEEELTQEDVDRVLNNLMKLAGVDNIADLAKAVGGADADAFADSLGGYAADEARDKTLEWILDQAAQGMGESAGVITKLLDTALISADQYERDQQKWKDRVDAANAQRKLNEFYYKVKDRLDGLRGTRAHGWSLQIEDSASHYFTFFTTQGNLQTWTVNLVLKKFDQGQNTGPGGKYSGGVSITVEYEMSPFDQGFADWAINKSGMLDAQNAKFQKMKQAGQISGHEVSYAPDAYDPTYIHRILDNGDYSTSLMVPSSTGQSTKSGIEFSGFTDTKETAIHHSLTVTFTTSGIAKYNVTGTFDYSSRNEDRLNKSFKSSNTLTMAGRTLTGSVNETPPAKAFDASVWDQWDKEKWLEITYP